MGIFLLITLKLVSFELSKVGVWNVIHFTYKSTDMRPQFVCFRRIDPLPFALSFEMNAFSLLPATWFTGFSIIASKVLGNFWFTSLKRCSSSSQAVNCYFFSLKLFMSSLCRNGTKCSSRWGACFTICTCWDTNTAGLSKVKMNWAATLFFINKDFSQSSTQIHVERAAAISMSLSIVNDSPYNSLCSWNFSPAVLMKSTCYPLEFDEIILNWRG